MSEHDFEIDLHVEGQGNFEYRTNILPRQGEKIRVQVDEIDDKFIVDEVEHHVFKTKYTYGNPSGILSYATLYVSKNY